MKLYLKLCAQLHTVCTTQLVKCSHSSHWSHCLYSLCTTAWDFVLRALWWRCRNKDNISQSRHALGRTSTAASLLSGTSLSCAPTCQLSAVSCQLSAVNCQLSAVIYCHFCVTSPSLHFHPNPLGESLLLSFVGLSQTNCLPSPLYLYLSWYQESLICSWI